MPRDRTRVFVLAPCALVAAICGGCASSNPGTRWSRHFDNSVWGGAAAQQVQHPDRLVPEATLLALVPLSFMYDDDIRNHNDGTTASSAAQDFSTALQVVLPAIPLTVGIVQWAHGDGGEKFEVVAESLGSVVLTQQLLAHAVGRERPNGEDDLSFPSGHSSWAFAATTLIVRELHAPSDDSFHLVDGLLYLPAVFAGWERIDADKHWTSDVVCGALLGVFMTNLVWDAHYGSDESSQPTIYSNVRQRGIVWAPNVEVHDGRLLVGITCGF